MDSEFSDPELCNRLGTSMTLYGGPNLDQALVSICLHAKNKNMDLYMAGIESEDGPDPSSAGQPRTTLAGVTHTGENDAVIVVTSPDHIEFSAQAHGPAWTPLEVCFYHRLVDKDHPVERSADPGPLHTINIQNEIVACDMRSGGIMQFDEDQRTRCRMKLTGRKDLELWVVVLADATERGRRLRNILREATEWRHSPLMSMGETDMTDFISCAANIYTAEEYAAHVGPTIAAIGCTLEEFEKHALVKTFPDGSKLVMDNGNLPRDGKEPSPKDDYDDEDDDTTEERPVGMLAAHEEPTPDAVPEDNELPPYEDDPLTKAYNDAWSPYYESREACDAASKKIKQMADNATVPKAEVQKLLDLQTEAYRAEVKHVRLGLEVDLRKDFANQALSIRCEVQRTLVPLDDALENSEKVGRERVSVTGNKYHYDHHSAVLHLVVRVDPTADFSGVPAKLKDLTADKIEAAVRARPPKVKKAKKTPKTKAPEPEKGWSLDPAAPEEPSDSDEEKADD